MKTTLQRLAQHPVVRAMVVVALVVGSVAITASSVAYFDDDEWPAFVIEKLPLPLEDIWLTALQVHVVAAALALPGCLLLMSKTILRRLPRLHRWLGRVVGLVVLVALAPSGMYMAVFAKGGAPAAAGFLLSGVVVVVAMVRGILTARSRDFVTHRRMVLHVLAQLSVAVSSRAMLFAFDAVGFDADVAYLVSLWLPVLGSAWIVERVCSPTTVTARSPRSRHEAHPRAVALAHRQPGLAG